MRENSYMYRRDDSICIGWNLRESNARWPLSKPERRLERGHGVVHVELVGPHDGHQFLLRHHRLGYRCGLRRHHGCEAQHTVPGCAAVLVVTHPLLDHLMVRVAAVVVSDTESVRESKRAWTERSCQNTRVSAQWSLLSAWFTLFLVPSTDPSCFAMVLTTPSPPASPPLHPSSAASF